VQAALEAAPTSVEKVPAAHALHWPAAAGSVTAPKKPGAHTAQAAADALPAAAPSVCTPGGQAVQAADPAAA